MPNTFTPHLKKSTIMKKMLLAAFALLLCVKLVAQNANVVLYTENGERFYAILNGIRMNDEPVTNLKVQDLNQPGYGLKVIFENKELGEMNKNMMVEAGSEAVYAIRLDKKGGYKLVFRSTVPIAQAAPPAPQQQIVYWGAPVVATTGTVSTGTTVTEQTTTTTTTTGTGVNTNTGTGESVSMNVTTDGFGLNINVSGTGTGTVDNATLTGTSTTVTTTTTTTSGTGGTVITEPVYVPQPAPCTEMYSSDFEKAKASIESKSFEDSKMTLAKQITSKNCLSAAQVKSIMQLFSFEASKLDYAKYAYDYCWEKNNYYQVNDAFDFESSISELDAYIGTR
jgi:hypothetical protein